MREKKQSLGQMMEQIEQEIAKFGNDRPRRPTFRELEDMVEEQVATVRARLLEEAILTHAKDDWADKPVEERPTCPECGTALQPRGKHKRKLQINAGRLVKLERQYADCPRCKSGFFPPG